MKNIKLFSALIIFCLLFVQRVEAQGWLWAKSARGNSFDQSTYVATDGMGNVYMTGYFLSSTITFGTTTLTNVGGYDIFLVKYDAAGNVLWAKSGEGTTDDIAISVTTDVSGNIYLTGLFGSPTITFGATTLTNTTGGIQADIFLVKYDAAGNVLWAKGAGGSISDCGSSVTTDGAGNVYLTGYYTSPSITFGTTTLTNAGSSASEDIFLVKYDTAGNQLWAKNFGSNGPDWASSVVTDGAGNVYMSGYFGSATITSGATTLTKTSGPYVDLFLVKFDAAGGALWARSANGIDPDYANSVTTDGAGNIYITGLFTSPTITFGSTTITKIGTTGASDIYVAKYDTTGTLLWVKSAGGRSGEIAQCVTSDCAGDVYITGFFGGPSITFGTTTLINADSTSIDIFVTKYSASGNVLWAKSIGSSAAYSNSIATDRTGNVYITGFFPRATITFGATTLTNTTTGTNDIFLAKYASTVSIPTIKNETHNLHLYPNPTTGAITLTFDNPIDITALQVCDILGRVVYEYTNIEPQFLSNKSILINLPELPDGVYVLSARGGKNTEYLQFVVRK